MDNKIIKGFSLLECMVALGLFAVILGLCEGMFVVQQKAGKAVTDDMERLNVVRQLLLRLEPLVSHAGFLGMQSLSSGLPIDVPKYIPGSHMPHQAVTIHRAHDQGWTPTLPSVLQGKVAKGSDVLILESADVDNPLPQSGWCVIADGKQAQFFWKDHDMSALKQHFPAYAVVGVWKITAFYVRQSEGGFELMQKSLLPNNDAVNILEKVEAFHCEEIDGLLQVTIQYAGKPMSIWLGEDNARVK